ncbi:DUF7507 domain-containing protein [Streptomyces catenulae]|uniref:DUF11 domain-containing protein n=1 Tax=Streptomyces catenulae TaxID=66875 RepID=A0ABV2Z1N7_9ACTN|nr:DUF11 domain-containing protein [Streptomyces catenulae]
MAQQAQAAPGDPFPQGPGLVFVAQGTAPGQPTTLYEAVQGTGQITFAAQGTAAFGYNAMGFRTTDRYLYAINNNDGLARIGQGGVATNLGQVGLPSSGTFSYNQGTFGDGATADTLYVRQSTSDNSLYAIDVPTMTSTRIALSTDVPNMSDIVWKDGYIWGVYGEGHQLVRIDPNSGAVLEVPLTGLPANPYGAQWVYGNGNIGISNNVTGTVYQLRLNNPTSSNPTVTILSSTRGPANTQNDGAAVAGEPADLGITKDGPATWAPGDTLTYTLRIHNYGPGDSSGYVVTDTLPDNLGNPTTTTDGCAVTTSDGQNLVQCTGPPLASGDDAPVITITGTAPDTPGTDCVADGISNTATVVGNESDPNPGNDTAASTACPDEQAPPSFTVSKTASVGPDAFVGPGDTVTYTVDVTNTGTQDYTADNPASFTDDLSDVTDDAQVDPDSLTGGAQLTDGGISWSGPLAVGETHTVTYTVTVNTPDAGDHVLRNAVTPGTTGSCTSADACTTTVPVASFTVSKSADPTVTSPGGVVHYTVTVTNNGAVDFGGTATPHAPPAHIEDALAGDLAGADYNGDADNGGTLQGTNLVWDLDLPVGATEQLTYSLTVHDSVAPGTELTNTVTPGPNGSCATPNSCSTTTLIGQYSVAKTVSATSAQPGDRVTYTVTLTNTGSAPFTDDNPASFSDDLTDVLDDATYNDDATGGATVTGTTLNWSGPLDVGATTTLTYSVTVNDPDTGNQHLRNAVTPGTGGVCAAAGSCATDVPVIVTPPTEPSLALRKQVVTPGPFRPGDRVDYTYTVTNTGNTTINDLTLADDRLSDITCQATSLDPDESTTCTGTYTVTEADAAIGTVRNTAVARGESDGTSVESPPDSAQIEVVTSRPALALRKTVDASHPYRVGDTATYTYTVTNTGNTTLSDITVTDNRVSGITCRATTLAPGTSTTCTGTYTVTAADASAGHVDNTAMAHGRSNGTPVESPTSSARIDIVTSRPALTIKKTVDSSRTYRAGDRITYTYTVTNTGDTTLNGITVTDNRVTDVTCRTTTLAPGESTTCTGTYTVTREDAKRGTLTNTAVATADNGSVRSDPAQATVKIKERKPCKGKDCRPCKGKDCNKPCKGKECRPCHGKHCDKPCKGKHCDRPCHGKHCHKRCDDKHGDRHCDRPCEGRRCEQE